MHRNYSSATVEEVLNVKCVVPIIKSKKSKIGEIKRRSEKGEKEGKERERERER